MTHDDEFNVIVKDLTNNPYVLDMKNFRQHCDTSTFEHSYKVAYISYKICKKLNLDYKSVARAGMLHDFYLYENCAGEHGNNELVFGDAGQEKILFMKKENFL